MFLAIKLSTNDTIEEIWRFIGDSACDNKKTKARVREKYPNFFQTRATGGRFQESSYQPSPTGVKPAWSKPDDLKGNTSDEGNLARRILKQNHLLAIDLTRTEVSKEKAKSILRQLLDLDKDVSDKNLKIAYRKVVIRIHPDKLKIKSGEEAFKTLNAAYRQAEL